MKILFVCTGNICRSPMAAQMFQQMLERNGIANLVEIDSAGTGSLDGSPLEPQAKAAIERMGFEGRAHSAQPLTRELVESANLVLTATQAQCTEVVELLVRANRYTFTLKEFAHLAEYELGHREVAKSQSPADLLAETLGLRGYATLDPDQDIADPYRKSDTAFDRAAWETKESLEQLVAWLG